MLDNSALSLIMPNLSFNDDCLEIDGCDLNYLAEQYGTPLYVMSERTIRDNCRIYVNALKKYYQGNGLILYASKAFCSTAMYRIVQQEGLGIDVVSGGELYTAMKAGFPADKIYFHGNNKTVQELNQAIEAGVGRIVVDNIDEFGKLQNIASTNGKKVSILLRLKPGIEAHTHEFICTGQSDSKFGFDMQNGDAMAAVTRIYSDQCRECIDLAGVHCHIGSQIFELAPFKKAVELLMDFVIRIKNVFGVEIRELNLGGGYGIKYMSDDDAIDYDKYVMEIAATVNSICEKNDINKPLILMEPGRSIVGQAGLTLYTIGGIKDIRGIRRYLFVDGGMTDNPRYALYKAGYTAVVTKKAKNIGHIVTIAGKCCESGDILVKDIELPTVKVGDVLAVLATGAYNYSMASNYNKIPRPAVVLVNACKHDIIVKRESYEQLTINDSMPQYLQPKS